MINGLVYDFESCKILMPTGLSIGIEDIEYSDEKGDEVIRNAQGITLGIGRGEYKGSFKATLARFEYDKLMALAAASGGYYNLPPFPVIASYGNSGQAPVTDTFDVHLNKRSFKGAKGDTNLTVPIEGDIVTQIVSDGVPAMVPYL